MFFVLIPELRKVRGNRIIRYMKEKPFFYVVLPAPGPESKLRVRVQMGPKLQ